MKVPVVNNEFHSHLLAYGGEYNPERAQGSAPLFFKLMLDEADKIGNLHKRNETQLFPLGDVYVGFVNNTDLNALTFSINHREYVGIYIGLFSFLFDLCTALWSKPNLIQSSHPVEGGRNEKEFDKALQQYFARNCRKGKIIRFGTFFPSQPKQAVRAWLLLNTVLTYVLYHEFGHLVRGHLGLVKTGTELDHSCLFEHPPPDQEPVEDNQIYRLLEMDADLYAASRILDNVLTNPPAYFGLDNMDMYSAFLHLSHAFLLVFYALDSECLYSNSKSLASHPSPGLRSGFVLISIHRYLIMGGKENLIPMAEKAYLQAISDVDKLWRATGLPKPSHQHDLQGRMTEASDLARKMFITLESELRPHIQARIQRFGLNPDHFEWRP
jgi:hypothetical protein